jgi:uncharacterized protein
MKTSLSIISIIIFIALSAFIKVKQTKSLNYPKPIGFVNDFEGILSNREEKKLNKLLSDFENKTQIEIAILTINNSMTTIDSFDNYTLQLARNWGIGKKGLNNGILIGFSSSFKKIRIQNASGIQKILSDEATKTIIDNFFIPSFKKGKYYEGFDIGTQEIIKKLK